MMAGCSIVRICRIPVVLACSIASGLAVGATALDDPDRAADFRQFCEFVRTEYAYFDIKATDWKSTCDKLSPMARAARSRDEFVATLEIALGQLYDRHAHLGTNTRASMRLVPTAQKAGVRAGDELLALDDIGVAKATAAIEPRYLSRSDPLALDWALDVAVAGTHQRDTRKLLLRSDQGERTIQFKADDTGEQQGLLEARRIGSIGYVRLHNSLGNSDLVTAFDGSIREFEGVTGFILDLRDTPSGGTSSVARGLLGHFVDRSSAYQRHEYVAEGRETGIPRVWVEYVAPRPPLIDAPVIVLVGAWTGSMGEGIAIGLHGIRGARVLGQRMAQLLGALGEVRLDKSGIVARVPNEKLFHVNGTPREDFTPEPVAQSSQGDATLAAALGLLAPKR
jgi:Peptidase family S41/Tricorn protease C1 domain